jgi:hypothetical protein
VVSKVNFIPRDFKRDVAGGDQLILRNRYYEVNPQLSEDGASLLARPGMKFLMELGEGPVRGMYAEEGSFDGDLFVAHGIDLTRVHRDKSTTLIYSGLYNPDYGTVNMTSTAPIGDVPEYLFFVDGRNLFLYIANGYAKGQLSGTPVNTDTVQIGSMYYRFTNGSVDTGSPAGTSGNPWLVALGLSSVISFDNLAAAVALNGDAGVQYSTATTVNSQAKPVSTTTGLAVFRATATGVVGNSVITTETGGLTWTNGGTMTGGGNPDTSVVEMPEDIGAFDVATINSFVIVLPVQDGEFKGRFYWIEPGETTVNPLNFATAERSPDGVLGVEVLGDQFWLPGSGSTEVWYVSQDPINRMQRLQGVVFDRGTWEGTAVAIHEVLIVCDANGAVFQISGGTPKRISTPDIEEQIRKSIEEQQRHLL